MVTLFKIISWFEGISYILLLFIATPIKYTYNNATYVKLLGMPHGLFFVVYIILAIMLKFDKNWNNKKFIIICLLSLLPFGTFFIGKQLNESKK